MKGTNFIKYLPYLLGAAGGATAVKGYQKGKMRAKRRRSVKRKTGRATTSRRGKRTKYKKRSKVSKNTRSIKKLQQHDRQSLGDMTYRELSSNRLLSVANEQNALVNNTGTANLETVLAQCKFFNPAVPGTLTTGSLATGTFQRNVRFESIRHSIICVNNYQTSCDVKIYECHVKDDTNTTVLGAWSAGLVSGTNLTATTDLGQYPSDYDVVNDLWRLKLVKSCRLKPGMSCGTATSTPAFEYASNTVDSHALNYQKEYKAMAYLVVITGALAHDTAVDQQTHADCGVDIKIQKIYKVKYDAGINVRFTHVDNQMDTGFTNLGVMSQKPISDNQAYSMT